MSTWGPDQVLCYPTGLSCPDGWGLPTYLRLLPTGPTYSTLPLCKVRKDMRGQRTENQGICFSRSTVPCASGGDVGTHCEPKFALRAPCACPSSHFLGYWPPWGGTQSREPRKPRNTPNTLSKPSCRACSVKSSRSDSARPSETCAEYIAISLPVLRTPMSARSLEMSPICVANTSLWNHKVAFL